MRVFVAGGTGVLGRRLVPQLVARGHRVTATTTSAGLPYLAECAEAKPPRRASGGRRLASTFPVLARIDARVEPRAVNGQPGAILRDRDDKVVSTLTLDVLGERIQTIRSVANPGQARAPGSRSGRLGG